MYAPSADPDRLGISSEKISASGLNRAIAVAISAFRPNASADQPRWRGWVMKDTRQMLNMKIAGHASAIISGLRAAR